MRLRCHASLDELDLHFAALDTTAAMGALVDACIPLRLRRLDIFYCRVTPAVLPELTRLFAAGALRVLTVHDCVFDTYESTRLFVTAVRASAMTGLRFNRSRAVPENVVEVAAFINALPQ